MGIGLAVQMNLIELTSGQVQLTSDVGKNRAKGNVRVQTLRIYVEGEGKGGGYGQLRQHSGR